MSDGKFEFKAKVSDGYYMCYGIFMKKAISQMSTKIEENDVIQITGNVQVQKKDAGMIIVVKDPPTVYKKGLKKFLGNPQEFNIQECQTQKEPVQIPGDRQSMEGRVRRSVG